MFLSLGVFLFNVMCALVPCDPNYEKPEIRAEPLNPQDVVRNVVVREVEPIVHLPSGGGVEGYKMKSSGGRSFFAFEGIPYGEAERWKSPVPKIWTGIRDAKKPGPDCLQINVAKMLRVYGSEDCLSVNVYTPLLPSADKKSQSFPVIVFIHGGSFLMGAGQDYGPSYIMNEDAVLVTLNYRLGVLGFFSTGDEVIPGNFGLKDQALALKWVHENIKYFGGSNTNVTLMGNSAGSVSTHLHLISNRTRNYFTSAFSSSGTGFNFWGVQNSERMKYLANRLAKQFRCQSEDSHTLANCLRRMSPAALAAAQLNVFEWFPFPPVLFSPTVEPKHPDAFLTVWPEEAYKTGDVSKVPYIVGATKDEGMTVFAILLPFMRTFPLRVMWNQIAPYFLQVWMDSRSDELVKTVNDFYLKGESPRWVRLEAFAEMVTDRYLTFGSVKGLQAHAASTSAPTYFYYFSFREGNHNLAGAIGRKSLEWGAGHGEDMFYFFNTTLGDAQKLSDPDRELGSIMVKLLVNFAATGEPSYTSETGEVFKIWEPVKDPSNLRALQFDKTVEMMDFPDVDINRLNFWTTLNLPNVTLWSPLTPKNGSDIKLKLLNGELQNLKVA